MRVAVGFPVTPEGITITEESSDYMNDAAFFLALDTAVIASHETGTVGKKARNAASWR